MIADNLWRHGCDDPHACGARLHGPNCPPGCTRHATACPQRYGGGLVFRRPKGKSKRTVTLPAPLVAALRAHKAAQGVERERACQLWQEQDLVFAQPDGRPIDPRRDWEEWKTILREAGVREVRVHDMRHTAGTLLVAQGVHIRAVQEILGHSDVRTTQGYTHISSEVARDAAQRMGSALWGADDA
jgi:site-specific recombinase XerD